MAPAKVMRLSCCECGRTRLPEARDYADLMLTELRKVIPSWVRRVDVADRGTAWSEYMEQNDSAMADLAQRSLGEANTGEAAFTGGHRPGRKLVDWDPDGRSNS